MMIHQLCQQFRRWGAKNAIKNIAYHALYRQETCSFGKRNADKTVYIIRSPAMNSKFYLGVPLDILAGYSYVLSHLVYAQEMGWYPVVDQLNYPMNNQGIDEINGTRNGWEYFWPQPSVITLEEAYHSRHVILSKRSWYQPGNIEYSVPAHMDQNVIHKFHQLMETIPLNSVTAEYCDMRHKALFPQGKKVLGVASRGGTMAKDSPAPAPNHPIQPSIDELIRVAEDRMAHWNMEYLFLTTEREETLERFRDAFGTALLAISRQRFRPEEKKLETIAPGSLYQRKQKYQTSLDYLTEMELLARCDGLIGAITSGLRYAIFRNGGTYQHFEVLDFGRFPDLRRRDLPH